MTANSNELGAFLKHIPKYRETGNKSMAIEDVPIQGKGRAGFGFRKVRPKKNPKEEENLLDGEIAS